MNTAVILIDMQTDFIDEIEHKKRKEIIQGQIGVLQACSKNDIPVITLEYANHGGTIAILRRYIGRVPRTQTIIKKCDDGFSNQQLKDELDKLDAKTLLLMGINANHCVKRTAESALKLGYRTVTAHNLIANGCACDGHCSNYQEWYTANGLFSDQPLQLVTSHTA